MEVVTSFLDNIKQKTTNPFFGTLICVWLVRNWEFVYSLFTFEDCDLTDKRKFIFEYFNSKDFWSEFGLNIWYTVCLLLLGYFFIIFSRIIMNLVYHRFIPFLNKHTVSNLVVDKNRFQTVKATRDEYFKKIEELEENLVAIQQRNGMLNSSIIEKDNEISNLRTANLNLSKKSNTNEEIIRVKDSEISILENAQSLQENQIQALSKENQTLSITNQNLNDRFKTLKNNDEDILLDNSSVDYGVKVLSYDYLNYKGTLEITISNDIGETIKLLQQRSLLSTFFKIAYRIKNYGATENDTDDIKTLVNLNILKSKMIDNKRVYELSEYGNKLYKFKNLT